jgi:hypothetical protein
MKTVEIYGLFDPESDEIRYVGKANNAQKRFKTHLLDSKTAKRPVCLWVQSLIKLGKVPVIRVLETVPAEQWEFAERRLIAEYRKTAKLLNLADGGAMPSQTREQRKKAARASNEVQALKPETWKRFIKAKQDMGRLYSRLSKDLKSPHSLSLAARMRFLMRIDAAKRPDIYGSWASL